jgi:hypothetical protein
MAHFLQFLLRIFLTFIIMLVLPLSHHLWGEPYPGDGQKGFGILMMLAVFGMAVATVYFLVGSMGQFLLRRRSFQIAVKLDLILFVLIALVLAIAGVTARYDDAGTVNPSRREVSSSFRYPREPAKFANNMLNLAHFVRWTRQSCALSCG